MTRDLNSGDLVVATPHYNVDLTMPEPIDLIRSVEFNVGNYYKYVARAQSKGTAQQDMDKAIWYAMDIAVHVYIQLLETGRPFLAYSYPPQNENMRSLYSRLSEAYARLPFMARALNTALNVLSSNRLFESSPADSVIRFARLQVGVLCGLRDAVRDGRAYMRSLGLHVKPLTEVYLGTRGQSIPERFLADVFGGYET